MEMEEVLRTVSRFDFPVLRVNCCQGLLKLLVQFNGKVAITQLVFILK